MFILIRALEVRCYQIAHCQSSLAALRPVFRKGIFGAAIISVVYLITVCDIPSIFIDFYLNYCFI